MTEANLYVESSALLRIVFDQLCGAEIAARLNRADRLLSSRLTRIECSRAVLRLATERPTATAALARAERDIDLLFDRIEIVEISADVAELARRVAPGALLRSLDAIHLATWQLARRIAPDLGLLTADRRLATAAGVDPLAD